MPQPTALFADLPGTTILDIIAADSTAAIDRLIHEATTRRAFQLFEESGRISGRDAENWRQAESEILEHGLVVRDIGTWISVDGQLPSISSEMIRIVLSPRRVLVDSGAHDIFFTADLGTDVDPKTAIASLKNGRLKLMAKKCHANSHCI